MVMPIFWPNASSFGDFDGYLHGYLVAFLLIFFCTVLFWDFVAVGNGDGLAGLFRHVGTFGYFIGSALLFGYLGTFGYSDVMARFVGNLGTFLFIIVAGFAFFSVGSFALLLFLVSTLVLIDLMA